MVQKPGQFRVVPVGSIVVSVCFLPSILKSIPPPNDVEFYLRRDMPIDRELGNAGSEFTVQHALAEDIDDFKQPAPVHLLPATLVQICQSFH